MTSDPDFAPVAALIGLAELAILVGILWFFGVVP
jgi:hypothetical protein